MGEMLAGGVGDYTGHKEAGLRAVLDMWMLASAHDLGNKKNLKQSMS